MAVGAIEPQFFAQLLARLELTVDDVPGQFESGRYDESAPCSPSGSRAGPATSGQSF